MAPRKKPAAENPPESRGSARSLEGSESALAAAAEGRDASEAEAGQAIAQVEGSGTATALTVIMEGLLEAAAMVEFEPAGVVEAVFWLCCDAGLMTPLFPAVLRFGQT